MATAKTIKVNVIPAQTSTTVAPEKSMAAKQPADKAAPPKAAPPKAAPPKAAAKKPLSAAFAPTPVSRPVKTAKTAKTAKTVVAEKIIKVEKPKKPKLVRDSFTIPKIEYVVLEALKQRATKLNRSVKKSELLRAGIKALASMADNAFLSALEKVPAIKTGRPASDK
jgi:hypothetical protein